MNSHDLTGMITSSFTGRTSYLVRKWHLFFIIPASCTSLSLICILKVDVLCMNFQSTRHSPNFPVKHYSILLKSFLKHFFHSYCNHFISVRASVSCIRERVFSLELNGKVRYKMQFHLSSVNILLNVSRGKNNCWHARKLLVLSNGNSFYSLNELIFANWPFILHFRSIVQLQ